MPAAPTQLETLHRIAIGDLQACLKVEQIRLLCWLLERLCWLPTRRFAQRVATYDRIVGEAGLPAAATWILERFAQGIEVDGLTHVPIAGPLLLVANHPGMTDAPAIFASLPRSDLRVVAAPHLLFRTLPHTSRYLIYVSEHAHERLATMRAVVEQLRAGGAVLIFPRGEMEPDPAILPGAVQSLEGWSESIALFIRRVPQAWVLPVVVQGVRAPATFRNPLTRLYRDQRDRERVAAVLQLLVPCYQHVTVHVTYGMPMHAADLAQHAHAGAITRVVTDQIADLLKARHR
jgi:1-acyl-sn-glycerol-3-phosphate acyltransferase